MVKLSIVPRSKHFKKFETESDGDYLVSGLLKSIASQYKTNANRIRLTQIDSITKKHVPLKIHATLSENGIQNGNVELYAKDLGPQIAWRTVFLIEYFGPLLIHPFFYYLNSVYSFNSGAFEHSQTQNIAYWLVLLHFLKREFETATIHKFSNDTMPFRNIFKNSGHYWILSGFNLAYFIYAPQSYEETGSSIRKFIFHVNKHDSHVNYALVALWAFAELSNLKTHITLANLRSGKNERAYVIPRGYGFDLVCCPNYFFESLAWFSYALLVGNWSSWLFLIVATGQMWVWAVKKNKRLLTIYGDEYKKLRRAIYVPYLF